MRPQAAQPRGSCWADSKESEHLPHCDAESTAAPASSVISHCILDLWSGRYGLPELHGAEFGLPTRGKGVGSEAGSLLPRPETAVTLIVNREDQSYKDEESRGNRPRESTVSLHKALAEVVAELQRQQLVVRGAPGVWSLRGDVQGLLESSIEEKPTGRRVFIGLRCDVCGNRAMTSLVGGSRLCEPCRTDAAQGQPLPPATPLSTSASRKRGRPSFSSPPD